MEVLVDEEFKSIIPPLTQEERKQLEESLLSEGCLDALKVWAGEEPEEDCKYCDYNCYGWRRSYEIGEDQSYWECNSCGVVSVAFPFILLDGHNRLEICKENDIPFEIVEIDLPDRHAAINWIINNQLGRRNLTPEQMSYLRGKRYNAEKNGHGGDRKSNRQNDGLKNETAQRLAQEYKVGERTIERDGQFASAVDTLADLTGEETRTAILQRDTPFTKKEAVSLAKWAEIEPEQAKDAIKQAIEKRPVSYHVSDDSYEWYTPAEYIEAARETMGRIDLDPASSEEAQTVVKAGEFYTKEVNGLTQEWHGNVWLNPPYNMPVVEQFIDRVLSDYENGKVESAIVLTNNSTDTGWFHKLIKYPVCFTKGRIQFWSGNEKLATRQGQAIFYLGENIEAFAENFRKFGVILRRYDNL